MNNKIMFVEMRRYLRVWWKLTASSAKIALMSRVGAGIFFLGKILRFGFILFFIITLVTKTQVLAGYTLVQVLVFYLTFNLIDTITQLLFRDVYRFRQKVVSGDFDLILTKPISPLFRILLGGADPLDLLMLIPYSLIFLGVVYRIPAISIMHLLLFSALFVNGLLIATAFHILVIALGILTTEIDHTIMIYRDISGMVRFPIAIYKEPLRSIITFVIPVGIMVSFPSQALLGALSYKLSIIAFVAGLSLFVTSIVTWHYALRNYTSASS